MTAEKLIELLEERGVLPERLLAKLRTKVADSDASMTAESLGKFLVQKGHLSAAQATNLLRLLAAHSEPSGQRKAGDAFSGDDDDEGSSIFPSQPTGKNSGGPAGHEVSTSLDNDDVLELVPIDETEEDVGRHSSDELDVADVARREEPPSRPMIPAMVRPVAGRTQESQVAAPAVDFTDSQSAPQPRLKERERVKKKQRRKNQWDSPLLLIGGGALAVLILCGATVALILNWDSGDDQLKQARGAAANGAYAQAITLYDAFLTKFTHHPEWSKARVQLAMVKLRSDVESQNYEAALKTAQDELAAIENEPKFDDAHAELAALLPKIARGLADEAEKSADKPDEAAKWTKASTDALGLCADPKYLPKTLRNEGELDAIEETLARVNRRQQSKHDLDAAVQAMQAAVEKGDTPAAYTAYKQVLQTHPELTGDELLKTSLVNTSKAEQASVKFVADEQKAETADRPEPWLATLTVANRRGGASAAATGTFCPQVDGAVYGIDVTTGKVLWRRFVGFGTAPASTPVADDILVVDSRFQELLRLDAKSGRLVWRQSLGGPFVEPLCVAGRAYVAAESGRLFVIDLASGKRLGYFQFAGPLHVPPVADRLGEHLYLAGDQASIYSISLKDQTCLGAFYLGHSAGSILVAPAQVLDKLVVLENDGVATCHLHLFSIDRDGAVAKLVASRRLIGIASSPPLVSARRVVAATDRGLIDVFEVGSGEGDKALTLVATREATDKEPLVRHVALTEGAVWVGDSKLTKFGVLPTSNRLPVQTLDNSYEGATFDGPLTAFGSTLIHVRRPAGRAGVIVAAMDAEHSRSLWETALAIPPAAAPVVKDVDHTLAAANVNGDLFRFDEPAIRARVQDQPLDTASAPANPKLTTGLDLGSGRAVFAAPSKSDQMLLYDPAQQDRPAQWIGLPSPLACAPTQLGEGLIVPLQVGQVFYVSAANGQSLAAPFQPPLQPNRKLAYRPAGAAGDASRQFVISDGQDKIYLVKVVDQPEPHLAQAAEGRIGPFPISSPIVVADNFAFATAEGGHLLRFQLPTLAAAGETDLSGDAVAGPYSIGELLLVVTANEQLVAVKPDGTLAWNAPLTANDLAGPPLKTDQGVLIAYRKGIVELRGLADGKPIRAVDLQQPLATGPVRYLNHIVLSTHDGTLVVANEP